ncbi:hypothetical protein OKW46_000530 [Paraburkholderia sp. WSM4179]|nr:hypothetical protein [Paraburkholderia sp. WSM4179]
MVAAGLKARLAAGRALVLATATHLRYAQAIADHPGCFDEVHATEGEVNLSARRKRDGPRLPLRGRSARSLTERVERGTMTTPSNARLVRA